MDIDDWTARQRWLYAIKPGSWPKLLVPMALGQAIGIMVSGSVSLLALAFGVLFTILDGVFIVLMNDWGDQHVDKIKREMFPDGCSPKTIPDGVLPASAVLAGGTFAGALAVVVAALFGRMLGLEFLVVGAAACVLLFVAYTLPPIRLNYRGGGELLEMVGVGFALPWLNAYAQSGSLWSDSYELLAGFAVLSLGSALASGLSDEESDRAGGKTTFTTTAGNLAVRRGVETSLRGGVILWLFTGLRGVVSLWAVIPAALVVVWHRRKLVATSPEAVTNAFRELKVYKQHLHHAIWYGGLALAAGVLLLHVVG